MKKILGLVIVLVVFFLVPSFASAKTSIPDNDLGDVVAQYGSITITFDDITIKSRSLVTTSTDGLHFWSYDPNNLNNGYHPKDTGDAFFGIADVYLTGGLVERSGSMTVEVVYTSDINIKSHCKLNATLNDQRVYSSALAIEATVKLGTTPDLAGDQILGRVYSKGIGSTVNGSLTVYAHNTPWTP